MAHRALTVGAGSAICGAKQKNIKSVFNITHKSEDIAPEIHKRIPADCSKTHAGKIACSSTAMLIYLAHRTMHLMVRMGHFVSHVCYHILKRKPQNIQD